MPKSSTKKYVRKSSKKVQKARLTPLQVATIYIGTALAAVATGAVISGQMTSSVLPATPPPSVPQAPKQARFIGTVAPPMEATAAPTLLR
jgi:hypothetical protein